MKHNRETILKKWLEMSPFNKRMAQTLSGWSEKDKPIIGIWRKRPNKQLQKLVEKYSGKHRDLTNHYVHKPDRPHFYWIPKKEILGEN